MTPTNQDCPSIIELESIAAGSTPGPATEAHVAKCDRCAEYLALARFSQRFGAAIGEFLPTDAQPEGSPSIHGYRINSEIARGGQGVVYRGQQIQSGKTVAIKVLPALSDATARARLHREMRIIAALNHPAIVKLIDSVRLTDGREALVMEHIVGTPITAWAIREKPDTPTRLRVLAEVADGLHHAHQHGVIHRDLTPSNILIDQHGKPRLLDFGIARVVANTSPEDSLTRTGEFTGTLAYSAPEQVSGEPGETDARTDIYSLAVILYQLLTASMPYPVDGSLEVIIRSITTHDPPSRSQSGLGADVWTVLSHAMDKDPKRRYQTAAVFAEDLRRAAEGRAIGVRASSPLYRFSVWIRRHRKPIAALLLFCITAIAMFLFYGGRIQDTDRARARSELATLLATGARERAETLLWEELDRVEPMNADPVDLLWTADIDKRSLIWAFAEMQASALCVAANRSFDAPPISIAALDTGEFGLISADRNIFLLLPQENNILVEAGPSLSSETRSARFVPTGDWIVAVTPRELQVVDARTGSILTSREVDQPPALVGLVISRDYIIMSGSSGQLELISLPDLHTLVTLPGLPGGQTAWIDPNKNTVWFLNQNGQLCTYDISASSTLLHDLMIPLTQQQIPAEIQVIPDRGIAVIAQAGKVIASAVEGSTSATPIVLHSGYRMNIGLGPESQLLSGQSAGDSTVRLWDTQTWQTIASLSGHSGAVLFSAESRDGRCFLTADSSGTLRLWALPGHDWRTDLSTDTDTVQDFAFSPDNQSIYMPAGVNGVRVIPLRPESSDSELIPTDFIAARTATHATKNLLAITDPGRSIFLHGVSSENSDIATLVTLDTSDTIVATHFSTATDRLYVATQDGVLIEIDPEEGSVLKRIPLIQSGSVSDFAISPDGSTMAMCTRSGGLALIDPKTLSITRYQTISSKQIRSMCFDPTGYSVVCVGDAGRALIFDIRNNRLRESPLFSEASLFDVAVHQNGRTIAIGDRNAAVHFLDFATLLHLTALRGEGSVMALDFTPDGSGLIVSCLEHPPQRWNISQLVRPLPAVRPPSSK